MLTERPSGPNGTMTTRSFHIEAVQNWSRPVLQQLHIVHFNCIHPTRFTSSFPFRNRNLSLGKLKINSVSTDFPFLDYRRIPTVCHGRLAEWPIGRAEHDAGQSVTGADKCRLLSCRPDVDWPTIWVRYDMLLSTQARLLSIQAQQLSVQALFETTK